MMHRPDDLPTDVPGSEADSSSAKNGDSGTPFVANTASVLALIADEERKLKYAAYRMTQCYEASRNIVADLKIRMLEREGRHSFSTQAHLRAHVYTVLRHLVIDWLKHRDRQVKIVFCHDPHTLSEATCEQVEVDFGNSPEEVLKALRPYLRELTEKEQFVFERRFLGVELHDIARQLGISEATVRKHHSNAVAKLRSTNLREALS